MSITTNIHKSGVDLGATVTVENVGGTLTIRFHSRGTTEGTRAYRAGMVTMLSRLAGAARTFITDVCVETRTTGALSRAERRIFKATSEIPTLNGPINNDGAEDVRKKLHTAAAKIGRPKGAKGGGNGTKQLRLYLKTDLDEAAIAALVKGR